ncbi:hypothetical protein COCNU_07G014070 [Cocos nucifera]|uniref:Uncharacterized protein n=1 Tax=Cocos nucifera TaxID=13894 RepID=A0A8K0N515_COCNU|nr:hypothetical protein COCNU_07G014070 [Cocos nucifera]
MASRIVEAELKIIKAKKVAKEWITEAGRLAMEAFKTFEEFNKVRITFSHVSFNTILKIGFDNCYHCIATWLPIMDLFLLDEDEEEEVVGESIPFKPAATEEQVGEELVVVEVSPSLTIGASTSMLIPPTEAPISL